MLVLTATFALYDNPPRKTQAENINNVQNTVEKPKEEPKQVNEIKPQTQEPVEKKPKPAPQPKQVEAPKPKPVPQPKPVAITGTKTDWMKQAGIPESQWVYVDYIVSRESSWNPLAVNSSSGACSLAQALPCSKIPGDWRDPVNALRWQFGYVTARYGGYAGAYNFWVANHWY